MAKDYYRKRMALSARLDAVCDDLDDLEDEGKRDTDEWKEMFDWGRYAVTRILKLQKKELGDDFDRRFMMQRHWYCNWRIAVAKRDYGIEAFD